MSLENWSLEEGMLLNCSPLELELECNAMCQMEQMHIVSGARISHIAVYSDLLQKKLQVNLMWHHRKVLKIEVLRQLKVIVKSLIN